MYNVPDGQSAPSTLDTDSILDNAADNIADEVPEPQQHAIDQASVDNVDQGVGESVDLDALGIPWNPEHHSTGADGKGIRTAKGTWRKRRGFKGSASYVGVDAARSAKPAADPETEKAELDARQAIMVGKTIAMMQIQLSVAIGGPEFIPRTYKMPGVDIAISEEETLTSAWATYCASKNIKDVPPGVALISCMLFYYLPRFREPPVRQRFSGLGKWIKDRAQWLYFKIKYRGKKPPKREPQTHEGTSTEVSESDAAS